MYCNDRLFVFVKYSTACYEHDEPLFVSVMDTAVSITALGVL